MRVLYCESRGPSGREMCPLLLGGRLSFLFTGVNDAPLPTLVAGLGVDRMVVLSPPCRSCSHNFSVGPPHARLLCSLLPFF